MGDRGHFRKRWDKFSLRGRRIDNVCVKRFLKLWVGRYKDRRNGSTQFVSFIDLFNLCFSNLFLSSSTDVFVSINLARVAEVFGGDSAIGLSFFLEAHFLLGSRVAVWRAPYHGKSVLEIRDYLYKYGCFVEGGVVPGQISGRWKRSKNRDPLDTTFVEVPDLDLEGGPRVDNKFLDDYKEKKRQKIGPKG